MLRIHSLEWSTRRALRRLQKLGLIAVAAGLVACAHVEREASQGMETELGLAGFKVMAADSAEKQNMLHSLPPQTVTRIVRPDQTYYIYADPNLCACLYVGRQAEYDALTRLGVERRLSDQQLAVNEMEQGQAAGWTPSGPWGNWGWGGGYGGYGGMGYGGVGPGGTGYGGGMGPGATGYGVDGWGGAYMRPAWDPW
ncbi:hypothetical protein [Methylotetracoccus oryzae]|uniref:hypothetical protein n=1 Tax=Methylotetracoccus oryzae TaxID=1919059 RepID=UPI001914245A|nr:hypothetical protein [Methylotetracoccus oryzae]